MWRPRCATHNNTFFISLSAVSERSSSTSWDQADREKRKTSSSIHIFSLAPGTICISQWWLDSCLNRRANPQHQPLCRGWFCVCDAFWKIKSLCNCQLLLVPDPIPAIIAVGFVKKKKIPAAALCIYKYADCAIIKAPTVFGTSAWRMRELPDYVPRSSSPAAASHKHKNRIFPPRLLSQWQTYGLCKLPFLHGDISRRCGILEKSNNEFYQRLSNRAADICSPVLRLKASYNSRAACVQGVKMKFG